MEQKTKFIIVGLIGVSLFCLFLFVNAQSSKQQLARERDDLKSENFSLSSKIEKLEDDLKGNQGKITSLQDELGRITQSSGDLQKKYDQAVKSRDELIEKLEEQRKQAQKREEPQVSQQLIVPENTDAYWAGILKAKTDLEIQLAVVRQDLKGLQLSNEALEREKNSLEIATNSLNNEKQDLSGQLNYNQKMLDSMAQEVVSERNDKTRIQDSLKTLRNENAVLIRQLKGLNNRKASLDKKVEDLQDGKLTVEKRLGEMEVMLADRVSQMDSLKDQLNAAKNGLVSAEKSEKSPRGDAVELPAIVVRTTQASNIGKREGSGEMLFSGKILAMNQDNRFVIIDVGLEAGAKTGDTFNVYRGQKNIGLLEVIQSRNDISACDIKKEIIPFKLGDAVK